MVPWCPAPILQSPQKLKRQLFWNSWSYEIKKHGAEVNLNGMTSLLFVIKVYQLVQNLLVGGLDGQTA
jgi:hypothetical protein